MPAKLIAPSIQCNHFVWRLICRAGVYYADGRTTAGLGKHSLATRDKAEALKRLAKLDIKKAVEQGILGAEALQPVADTVTIEDGWQKYMSFASRDQVMGGASPGTIKRYRAVRDNHLAFCALQRISTWNTFDKRQLEKFGNFRSRKQADRTVYLELTTVKSVSKWLVAEQLLPPGNQLHYTLSKPQGTDIYCYRPEEVSAMVEHCRAKPELAWLADLIVFLAHTGGPNWRSGGDALGGCRPLGEHHSHFR